jgi:hypothetical protein
MTAPPTRDAAEDTGRLATQGTFWPNEAKFHHVFVDRLVENVI